MTDPVWGYDEGAEALAARYEQLRAEDVHAAFLDILPAGADRLALDIGAGSGRDAAWLRRLGFEVAAVEPAQRMREAAQALHASRSSRSPPLQKKYPARPPKAPEQVKQIASASEKIPRPASES